MTLKELISTLTDAYEKGAADDTEVRIKTIGDDHLSPLIGVTLDIQHTLNLGSSPFTTASVVKLWIDKQEDYEA